MNAIPLSDVLNRPDVWRGNQLAHAEVPTVASGFAALDAELPGGGWARGALVEMLVDGAGLGECSLLLPALSRVQGEGRWVVLVAPPHAVYAPAWAQAGIDLSRLVVVAPAQLRDALWSAEQALASGSPGAVLCWAGAVDAGALRRLQVAAAERSGLAFLFRPSRAAAESSPAPLRLHLKAAAPDRLGVRVLKRRGQPCHRLLQLEVARPWARREDHASTADLAGPACAFPFAGSACALSLA